MIIVIINSSLIMIIVIIIVIIIIIISTIGRGLSPSTARQRATTLRGAPDRRGVAARGTLSTEKAAQVKIM